MHKEEEEEEDCCSANCTSRIAAASGGVMPCASDSERREHGESERICWSGGTEKV